MIKLVSKDGAKETVEEEESALIYLPDGLLAVRMPQVTSDPAERIIILRWYATEGEEVEPGQFIVRIATMYDRIDMPVPPLQGRYRIHRIEKQPEEILVMGDVFVTLQVLNDMSRSSEQTQAD